MTETETKQASQKLRLLAFTTLVALLVQFLLGMATNLYVTVPQHDPWATVHPAVLLYLHGFLGVALTVNSVMVQSKAAKVIDRRAALCGAVGLAGIVVAFVAGLYFVSGTSNAASLFMSGGFAMAAMAYATILVLPARRN
jgi:hypothetical protein